jgi:hypothetical protein
MVSNRSDYTSGNDVALRLVNVSYDQKIRRCKYERRRLIVSVSRVIPSILRVERAM